MPQTWPWLMTDCVMMMTSIGILNRIKVQSHKHVTQWQELFHCETVHLNCMNCDTLTLVQAVCATINGKVAMIVTIKLVTPTMEWQEWQQDKGQHGDRIFVEQIKVAVINGTENSVL